MIAIAALFVVTAALLLAVRSTRSRNAEMSEQWMRQRLASEGGEQPPIPTGRRNQARQDQDRLSTYDKEVKRVRS